jgi:diguanylate cyclase (GGDEF)-like protein
MEKELLYLSSHDQLTKLYNRHYFVNAIERLEKSNSYPIAIISADIDGLKKVNDSYGHKVGDEYIKTCSMILEESTIKGSLIARVGGDEFAIVLPNSDLKNGNEVVANIKRKVKEYDSNIYDVGISLGIAIAENNSVSLEEIYNKADKKMYEDKKKFN